MKKFRGGHKPSFQGGKNKDSYRGDRKGDFKEHKEGTSQVPKRQKYLLSGQTDAGKSYQKVLLFPGEQFEFKEDLIHYDAFGYSNGNLVVKKCGILLCDPNTGTALQDTNEEVFRSLGKYYSPKVDDPVLGVIVQKSSEFYRIDIGSYSHAILNTKDFEGATKKAKPNLNLGDLIFARVQKVNKFDVPVLSCISPHEHKNWASGESFFGNLQGGNLFSFNKLNTWEFYKNNYALNRLNDVVDYEIVIGFNGKMWINSDTPENIYNIYDILVNSLNQTQEETEKIIHTTFIDTIKK